MMEISKLRTADEELKASEGGKGEAGAVSGSAGASDVGTADDVSSCILR